MVGAGEAMYAAAFSSDGSMLGVASQDEITLWDPYTNSMLTSLASPPGNQGCPIAKLLFVPNTPFLAGYTTGPAASLIVWSLLTESIWWSYALTCSALAVDPESSCIAVAVTPQKEAVGEQKGSQKAGADGHKGSHEGQAAGLQQQAQNPMTSADAGFNTAEMLNGPMTVPDPEGRQASMGSSAVFLFVPSSGQPQLSWSLGQATVAALLFALSGTKLHSVSLDVAPAGISPLLILTEDRQYAVARSAARMHHASFQPSRLLQSDQPSAFEAAFGKAAVQQPVQQAALSMTNQSQAQSQLQALFDAPSHVLPPLKDLAPVFFDNLIRHSGGAV